MDTTAFLDTGRLLAFMTVAHAGGFSRAARRLGKTQSSVSQAVALLEHEVGQQLFQRDPRSVRLTAAGVVLLQHAEALLQEMTRARENLGALGELRTGRLTVGTSDTLAYHLLPPLLADFRRRFPAVELALDNRPSPGTATQVAEGVVDVGIVSGPLPRSLERVRFEPLFPQRDVLICPPGHPLARRRRISLRVLGEHPLLLLNRSTSARAHLDDALRERAIAVNVVMEMGSVEVLKRLVELGFGVSVVPSFALGRELREGTLAAIELEDLADTRSVGLVLRRAGSGSRAAEVFAEQTRAFFLQGGRAQRSGRVPTP